MIDVPQASADRLRSSPAGVAVSGGLDAAILPHEVPPVIVTRIRPLSLAKVTAVVYAAIGLFIGAIVALASFFGAAVGSLAEGQAEPWLGAVVGLGALVAAPVFYGGLGFLGGLFTAAVYNVAARAMGGVELEVGDR